MLTLLMLIVSSRISAECTVGDCTGTTPTCQYSWLLGKACSSCRSYACTSQYFVDPSTPYCNSDGSCGKGAPTPEPTTFAPTRTFSPTIPTSVALTPPYSGAGKNYGHLMYSFIYQQVEYLAVLDKSQSVTALDIYSISGTAITKVSYSSNLIDIRRNGGFVTGITSDGYYLLIASSYFGGGTYMYPISDLIATGVHSVAKGNQALRVGNTVAAVYLSNTGKGYVAIGDDNDHKVWVCSYTGQPMTTACSSASSDPFATGSSSSSNFGYIVAFVPATSNLLINDYYFNNGRGQILLYDVVTSTKIATLTAPTAVTYQHFGMFLAVTTKQIYAATDTDIYSFALDGSSTTPTSSLGIRLDKFLSASADGSKLVSASKYTTDSSWIVMPLDQNGVLTTSNTFSRDSAKSDTGDMASVSSNVLLEGATAFNNADGGVLVVGLSPTATPPVSPPTSSPVSGPCPSSPPTACPQGHFFNNVACSPCLAGTYSTAGGTCTQCQAGTFSGASASSCSQCDAGKFSSSGASNCLLCSAGTFSSSRSGSCTACSSGKSSAAGSSQCDDCPAGSSSITKGSATCTICPSGTFAEAGASSCTACSNGQYSSPGATTCVDCAS